MSKKLLFLGLIIWFSSSHAQENKSLYSNKKVAVSNDTIVIEGTIYFEFT